MEVTRSIQHLVFMEKILHNFFKILFGGIFISAGIGLPTIMSTGHFLECQPDRNPQGTTANTRPPTVTCEILQMGGGTLLTKGTQVIDRQPYQQIRRAEVATIQAKLTSKSSNTRRENGSFTNSSNTVQKIPIEKLVLVLLQGKQTVNFPFAAGMASTIVSQINNSIANPNAPKFSIEIGHSALLPQVMGWVFVVGGVLVFCTKSIGSSDRS
jgi:hypothetical protein